MTVVHVLNKLKQQEPKCTLGQMEDFKDGLVWQTIQDELGAWLIETYERLESTEDERTVHLLQARARCIRETLHLPDELSILIKAYYEERDDS